MQQSPFLKSLCLTLASVLVALLAIGPFLHAHYGASQITGLHVAGVSAVGPAASGSDQAYFSQSEEPESAAIGVETSYARDSVLDVHEQPQMALLLTLVVCAALVALVSVGAPKRQVQPRGRTSFIAGFPALPHAPPVFHL